MRVAAAGVMALGIAAAGASAQTQGVGGAFNRGFEPLPEAPAPTPRILPAPARAASAPLAGGPLFVLRGVRFIHDTPPPFTNAELASVVAPLIGREVGAAELEAARRDLTERYLDAGYVSSGALLPDQEIVDGVVTYRLVHGILAEVNLSGEGLGPGGFGALDPAYVRRRVVITEERPFDAGALERRLRILLEDRNIEAVRAVVRPGERLGDAVLDAEIATRRPVDLAFTLDNASAPSVGATTVRLAAAARNAIGVGDEATATFEASQGAFDIAVAADAPLGDGTVSPFVRVEYGEASVVTPPLDALDVESDLLRLEAGVRVALLRDPRRRMNMTASLEHTRSETRLLGRPFSFAAGVQDGESRVSVVRLAHEAVERRAGATVALRSELRLGIDAFDATRNNDAPDGVFAAWIGQAQGIFAIGRSVTVIGRVQSQLASDGLLPVEDVAIGGLDTVRGYPEAFRVADQAALASFEARISVGRVEAPGLTPAGHDARVTVSPFVDAGAAWDKGRRADADVLMGAGVGLQWSPAPGVDFAAYGALALRDRAETGGGVLENGAVFVVLTLATP